MPYGPRTSPVTISVPHKVAESVKALARRRGMTVSQLFLALAAGVDHAPHFVQVALLARREGGTKL